MLGFRYFKCPPTSHVIKFRNGKIILQGVGQSFFYFAPTTTLVMIPVGSIDIPFVFEEVTQDFQDVTIQGQITYKVSDSEKLSKLLDFSIDARGRYTSEDPSKLNDRLIQLAQVKTHGFAQNHDLRTMLLACDELGEQLQSSLAQSSVAAALGIELMTVSVLSIRAAPEMAKAMQADAREQLLLKADQAVYARRNTAIELERQIKENELITERNVEEKKREIREVQMKGDIVIEQQRAELVDRQVANNRKLTDAQIHTLRESLDAMKSVDWKTIVAANGGGETSSLVAMAFQQLAENAGKIGRLDISSEVMSSLLGRNSGPE